jgi:hypothetical protein
MSQFAEMGEVSGVFLLRLEDIDRSMFIFLMKEEV